MSGVIRPQGQRKDGLGQVMSLANSAAQVYGGNYLAVGDAANTLNNKQAGGAPPPVETAGAKAAMQRRADALQPIDPNQYGNDLARAEQAAQTLPPEMQKQYLPPLQRARAMNQGGVA